MRRKKNKNLCVCNTNTLFFISIIVLTKILSLMSNSCIKLKRNHKSIAVAFYLLLREDPEWFQGQVSSDLSCQSWVYGPQVLVLCPRAENKWVPGRACLPSSTKQPKSFPEPEGRLGNKTT